MKNKQIIVKLENWRNHKKMKLGNTKIKTVNKMKNETNEKLLRTTLKIPDGSKNQGNKS